MAQSTDCGADTFTFTYPRFEHGESLYVLVHQDDSFEFRSESVGEYIRADNTVYVEDLV